MSERDPFEKLRDLIDQPVEPRAVFADQLRGRLMSELSASEHSWEEQPIPMNAVLSSYRPAPIPFEPVRRIRPITLLQLAATVAIFLGLAAVLGQGWFRHNPEPPTVVPAAMLQTDATPTAEPTLEPAVVPPANIAGAAWVLPGTAGAQIEFGGVIADDHVVYRLLSAPSFTGIQAVDIKNGNVLWQQDHPWTGTLFVEDDDLIFFDGGDNTLVAVKADTGEPRWSANVNGSPIALQEDDHRFFVLLESGAVAALDADGNQLWVAQGPDTMTPTQGSATGPATGRIETENGVVAALASNGILAGFDRKTGTVLWSHDGYDVATTTIDSEDDQFLVIEGGIDCTSSAGSPLGVQIIDPQTGDIRSDTQVSAAAVANACATAIERGNTKLDPTSQHLITVGTILGASSAQQLRDEEGHIVLIGTIEGIDQPIVGVTIENRAAFLQLADGTLVRVETNQRSGGS